MLDNLEDFCPLCTYARLNMLSCKIMSYALTQKGMEVYIMKMFNNTQKNIANTVFEKEIKPRLKEKDGFTHVIMVNSFSKFLNQNFGCEDKYTTQIDDVLTNIQQLGYEIVDIKVTVLPNQGLTGNMEGFNTLIVYK